MSELRPDTAFEGRIVSVEPIAEHHREDLREAAEQEPQIHRYTGMYSLGFDRWFDEALGSETSTRADESRGVGNCYPWRR